MEPTPIGLYEFLVESELQHYYNAIKNELKITNATQFKYATDEDLRTIGLSRPEIRRLRKFYEKYFPHGYLSKIKRLLNAPTAIVKRDENNLLSSNVATSPEAAAAAANAASSPNKVPNNKHIIPADAISVNKELGTGEFGVVQQGVWTNGTDRIQVAIKCLCRERMQSNPMEFLKEAAIMHSIEHENIVRLYGVVLATDSLMLVTELAHLRSLLECLKDSGLRVSFLTVPTLCEFAVQICNGMKYLENKRLIHRDLAARNILVFNKNKVKISDFGLSRALGVGKDYYKTNFNVNLKLPIAWCAPECINYLRFTNASDVWAFGVCLWEMFSYGFQPWAALTGLQILEAIDAPNYQRLEPPDCCPREYYNLMLKCWQDDPLKRPKFSEIYELLPDLKPEQLKAVVNNCEPKKDYLLYRQGDIITVLDRNTGTAFWKGVLNSGKIGYFNPSNTVAYLEGLPCSNRDSFHRASERSSKRKLRTEMISKPQNDLKHTGHVGIDGASFGNVAFLGNSQSYNYVPRQIVTPYKPSEDIEQTPLLLPPTPTSPDSLQTASGYFPEESSATSTNLSFLPSTENTPKHLAVAGQTSFDFSDRQTKMLMGMNASPSNPFTSGRCDDERNAHALLAMQNNNYGTGDQNIDSMFFNQEAEHHGKNAGKNSQEQHEYHEISDDEIAEDKLDLGPSLLDEINSMIGSMTTAAGPSNHVHPHEIEHTNMSKKNDGIEAGSKFVRKNGTDDTNGNKFGASFTKKKTAGTVKPISVKDEKILNQAIEIANEISARSMTDLVSDQPAPSTQSPKRKFSFRFSHLTNNGANDKSSNGTATPGASGSSYSKYGSTAHGKNKNFTEELKSIPDLQTIIGEEGREAYNSLIERKASLSTHVGLSPAANLLMHLNANEFDLTNVKTLPRRLMSTHDSNTHADEPLTLCVLEQKESDSTTSQFALRPMTLPTRGATNRLKKAELSATTKHILNNGANSDAKTEPDLNERQENLPYGSPIEEQNSTNPIPLPSREGKKHIKTNPKRHVRKYPLIIPANGVQRTLNKLSDQSSNEVSVGDKNKVGISTSLPLVGALQSHTKNDVPNKNLQLKLRDIAHTYQNLEENTLETCTDSSSLQFESIMEADYNKSSVVQSPDVTDSFYNFSIQKENYNKSKGVDFDPKKISGFYINEDELRNLDIEKNVNINSQQTEMRKKLGTDQQSPSTNIRGSMNKNVNELTSSAATSVPAVLTNRTSSNNELAGNALFMKIRDSVNMSLREPSGKNGEAAKKGTRLETETEYLASKVTQLAESNSVSCEDLLEFASKKPNGAERGVDSDEVRIMMKVLGTESTPTRCLDVLDFIDWDVHKAIKVIKLQNIFPDLTLAQNAAVNALEKYKWDLHTAALATKKDFSLNV